MAAFYLFVGDRFVEPDSVDTTHFPVPWSIFKLPGPYMDDFESGHQVLTEPQAQSQSQLSLAGDCINAAFRNDKPVSMMDLLLNDVMLAQPQGLTRLPTEDVQHALDQQPVCGAIAPLEPGSQTPGVTVGVALRLPHLKLPSENQSATASNCDPRKVLNEVSAGTNLMATSRSAVYFAESNKAQGKRRKRLTPRADKVHECKPCKKFFNSKKDLHRHLRSTKAHNARPVAYCTCGKSVTRTDAMRSHRAYCQGTTVETGAAQAAGD